MPIYKHSSLQKHPWLWKYDSRRSGRCSLIGHRFKWFHYEFKSYHGFFGTCKKCLHVAMYKLSVDRDGLIGRVYKQFGKVVEMTKDEAHQFVEAHKQDECQPIQTID